MDPLLHAAAVDELAERLRRRLLADVQAGGDASAHRIDELVDREAAALDAGDRLALSARIAELALGLGPLEPLLRDPEVDEILVSGTRPVWVERAGRLHATESAFASEGDLRHAIERLIAPAGRRADEADPLCDARLRDGSRVNVVLPPLAVDGPSVTIRRFRPRGLSPGDLVARGSWTGELHCMLSAAVSGRLSVLVSGATGTGKTTTLGALSAFVGPEERVVTIEDTAELRLAGEHVVRLEARPPGPGGRGEVTIRDLVRNALRMRPDRIIVGEVRGPEALDMLGAMTTGHAGSLCTVHAGSPVEALGRIETLALMAGVGLPHAAVRAQVAGALDLVVHQERGADGLRRVVSVAEVVQGAGGPGVGELYAVARRPRASAADAAFATHRRPARRRGVTGLLGGLAAALAVPALFEALGFAGAARVLDLAARALAPARAAGRDGHAPPRGERWRLGATAAGSLCATGWLAGGPGGAAVCGLAGPPLALGVVAARRRRWRAAVADGAPAAARAIADALDAGSALPRALALAVSDGAVAAPARRLLGEAARAVELGARTDEALLAAAGRAGPGAWRTLVAATVLQRGSAATWRGCCASSRMTSTRAPTLGRRRARRARRPA